ncbi:MAG: AMP-binding protein, partial [Geminicoccaceae bacterium]
MNRPAVLDALEANGVQIALVGDNLKLEGPTTGLDDDLISRLREDKPAIVAYLAASNAAPVFPLDEMQEAYWIGRGSELGLGGVSSHVYHELEGCWDIDRLQAAFAKVVVRHGALRTAFVDGPYQQELPAGAVQPIIRQHDHRVLGKDEQRQALLAIRAEMSHQVLPADQAPLLDMRLSIFAGDMVLHVSHDGLVMDGISMLIFFRDWADAYEHPERQPTALAVDFRDQLAFDAEQRKTAAYQRARDFWLQRLEQIPPAPQLPLRQDPASLQASPSTRSEVAIDPGEWCAIREHGQRMGLTPTVVLASVYADTLATFSGGDDFTLNATLANRMPTHPDIFDVIGNFTSPLLLPCRFDGRTTFAGRAAELKAAMAEGLEHRHFSGIEVMRALAQRQGAARALMPVTLNCALGAPGDGLDGSAIDRLGKEVFSISQTPQVWLNLFAMEKSGSLIIQFDAVEALFPTGFIDEFAAVFRRALRALTAPTAWEAHALTSLPASQCARRRAVNDTETPMPSEMLHDAFLRQAASTPEADAVILPNRTITYRELADRAAAIAHWLRSYDLERDELVAVLMGKGWEQIAAALGTLMAGGAYLPIDPDLPEARIEHLVENGRARVILTQSVALNRLPQACGRLSTLVVDEMAVDNGLEPPSPLPDHDPDDLAYVLFTSGSTGQPKGVMISHRSVVNLVEDINRRFEVGPGDRLFGVSAFNFDLSVYDIFGALSSGAALILPDQHLVLDPDHWADWGETAGATIWNSVPAIVQMLSDAGLPASLRLVMMSGDR